MANNTRRGKIMRGWYRQDSHLIVNHAGRNWGVFIEAEERLIATARTLDDASLLVRQFEKENSCLCHDEKETIAK